MIIAIINQHHNADRCVIARNLAVLRARSGRKVCLLAAGSAHGTGNWCIERSTMGILPLIASRSPGRHAEKIEWLRRQFNDIVVDAGERNSEDCHGVLIAAKLAVVPVRGKDIDLANQYALIERIKAARLFNPALRILFVAVTGQEGLQAEERASINAHVARLDLAVLANTVLHDPSTLEYGPGRCVCDAETCDPKAARQMRNLYDEACALVSTAGAMLHVNAPPARAFMAL